jgi:hypothetical protein
MSDQKPKSTMRQILESGPTDPLMMQKLTLLEELQAAHAQGDQSKMLEIGRYLAENAQQTKEAQENRRAKMRKAVAAAKRVADPDERTQALLSAFEFCVREACAADEEGHDLPTYNFGVKRLSEISDELRKLDRFTALAKFLDSPNIELRGFAAVWLRNIWPERILPILREINKTKKFGSPVGIQVFTAIFELEHTPQGEHGAKT